MAKPKIRRTKVRGGLLALKKRLDAASKYVAVAGVFGPRGAAEHGGLTVAQIGALHEYGYSFTSADGSRHEVPARSFVRVPIRDANAKIQKALARASRKVIAGGEPQQELETVALVGQGVMQKAMSAGLTPPLAESTIARRKGPRKGHKGPRVIKPLIDTGQLRSAITSVVRKRGAR